MYLFRYTKMLSEGHNKVFSCNQVILIAEAFTLLVLFLYFLKAEYFKAFELFFSKDGLFLVIKAKFFDIISICQNKEAESVT